MYIIQTFPISGYQCYIISWSWGQISQLALMNCYKLAAAHYWIYLINTRVIGGVLFASCFFSVYKRCPSKQEAAVCFIPCDKRMLALQRVLLLSHNEHNYGNNLPVAVFNNAHHIHLQDKSPPYFLKKIKKTQFWPNRSTKLLEVLQFCKDTHSTFKLWGWLLFSSLLGTKYPIKQMR